MNSTKCSGHWKRNRLVFRDGDAEVRIIAQTSGKHDNAIIDFGSAPFDGRVLFNVFQRDQFNCYPYVIRCRPEDEITARTAATQFGIASRVLINPDLDELMYACGSAKGASKGFNASKSHKLDKIVFDWTKTLLMNIDSSLDIVCPREQGSGNEDIRVSKNNKKIFRQEDKSISEQQNITERLHMVKGKGTATGDGDDYDLFMSFEGYNLKFLDYVPTHAPAHIAKAYVEFDVAEQTILFTEKPGTHPTLDSKRVKLPVDVNDPSRGLEDGPLLKDYIISVVKNRLLQIK